MTQDVLNEFRKGKELCLKNFETWIDEARILDQKGSWGHAYALIFAGLESLAQAYCCMYVERGIWKPDSKEIKEVFNKTNKGHKKRMKILHDFILSENNIQAILKHTDQFHALFRNFTEKDVAKYQKEVADSLGKFRKYLMKKRNLGRYVDCARAQVRRFHFLEKRQVWLDLLSDVVPCILVEGSMLPVTEVPCYDLH